MGLLLSAPLALNAESCSRNGEEPRHRNLLAAVVTDPERSELNSLKSILDLIHFHLSSGQEVDRHRLIKSIGSELSQVLREIRELFVCSTGGFGQFLPASADFIAPRQKRSSELIEFARVVRRAVGAPA